MEARALKGIVTMLVKDRFSVIAEGLELLIEHVGALTESAESLRSDQKSRSAAILSAFAVEEAAKILILLDLARHGWKEQATTSRLLKNFSSHMARGIYVEVTSINPGSFAEVREFIETLRPSRYLDGPNDIEWIYRNKIEVQREEALYVDYVKDEEGYRWVSPRNQGPMPFGRSQIVDTVMAMERLGLLTLRGLTLTTEAWKDTEINDEMSWPDNASRNHQILKGLWELNAFKPEATNDDTRLVMERWTFPMGTLDLRKIEVTDAELARQRANGEARMYADWYGNDSDYY